MENDAKSRAEQRQADHETRTSDYMQNWELPPALAARMEVVEQAEKNIESKVDDIANTFA